MGVELKARNLAQVSINLTDYEQTPMHRVYELVKREAERYGAMPVGSRNCGPRSEKGHRNGGRLLSAMENFSRRRCSKIKLAAASREHLPKRRKKAISPNWRVFSGRRRRANRDARGRQRFRVRRQRLPRHSAKWLRGLSRKKKSQAAHVHELSEHSRRPTQGSRRARRSHRP